LAILEIQDRFKKYYFQKFTKKNDEQIFTSLSFKISPILPKIFCDPEPENLTEVWTHLKKQRLCTIILLTLWTTWAMVQRDTLFGKVVFHRNQNRGKQSHYLNDIFQNGNQMEEY